MYTIKEAAEIIGRSTGMIINAIYDGRIKARMNGGRWEISKAALDKFRLSIKCKPDEGEFYTVAEMAKITGYTAPYLSRHCRQGGIKAEKTGIGKRSQPCYLISGDEMRRFASERGIRC